MSITLVFKMYFKYVCMAYILYFNSVLPRLPMEMFNFFNADISCILTRDRLYMSESYVCRRQILTSKNDPRTERIDILIMAVDP